MVREIKLQCVRLDEVQKEYEEIVSINFKYTLEFNW